MNTIYQYRKHWISIIAAIIIVFSNISTFCQINQLPFQNNMFSNVIDSLMIDVNRFNLPMDNIGTLGDVLVSPNTQSGGQYDARIVLYSGGFFLTGISDGLMWSNGSFTASRISDYVAGKVGSVQGDPKNILYVVKSTDPPFGQSWQNWKIAVSQGADFYDGNHDGIYNPVDLNGNGKWDSNEDRPDLLGDVTVWCVFNDGVPSAERTFSDVQPQGIEIQQTVFAQRDSADLNNVVFIRYRLINRGTVSDLIDSVYFGSVNDIDIGDNGGGDLLGSDITLNSGYMYHLKTTQKWGYNPPSETITLLQGPLSYIPSVTFNDINGNGIYDTGIDIPIDSAINLKGPMIGETVYPGAKNLNISSVFQFYGGIDPATKLQLRNYLTGYENDGEIINPCTWVQGQMYGGVSCSAVNPFFMYSGDPVTQTGWINITPRDQRIVVSSGPFKLEKNNPVDILVAYIVGRGSDGLNSIDIAKGYAANTIAYYKSNFPKSIITGIKEKPAAITDFRLDQNYPNPFNPSTKIQYSVITKSLVRIIVNNILG